ncbi:MAG: 16S rRNA (guanine(966)-N(2))-methyltransferase RsmD [Chlamydiia bacterium]|nr:16S rRNA (guanine(966)-N(2))-methyltransferase RsmD [Chlamydiia bacterium]
MSLRIIGGKFKGRPLKAPKGLRTRPTQSMLREAVFNICQNAIEGARFLDLFAGSGAMGLEALSRGAARTTFIEKDRSAIAAITENIASLDVKTQCQLSTLDAKTALQRCEGPFDIIYIDPPYGTSIGPLIKILEAEHLLSSQAALFIEERYKKGSAIEPILGMKFINSRRFGDTLLHYYIPVPPQSHPRKSN